jgi:hypothetical protein
MGEIREIREIGKGNGLKFHIPLIPLYPYTLIGIKTVSTKTKQTY